MRACASLHFSHLLHGRHRAPAVAHFGLEAGRPGRRQVLVGQDHEVRDTDSLGHVSCEAKRSEGDVRQSVESKVSQSVTRAPYSHWKRVTGSWQKNKTNKKTRGGGRNKSVLLWLLPPLEWKKGRLGVEPASAAT